MSVTPIAAERFTRFAVADWSGAKGSRHPGIAIAECGIGEAAPALVPRRARTGRARPCCTGSRREPTTC